MAISDTLAMCGCEQIGHEIYNANLYLYIAAFLKNKGLDNLAKHFEGQHKEEIEHSLEFYNLMTDLNCPVMIPEIDEINIPFNSILDIASAYLSREEFTTKSINEIKKIAISEDSPIIEEKMREMIAKQQNELAEANSFMDKAVLLPEWWQCALWDASL